MNLINLFERYWKLIFIISSFILAILIIIFIPGLILNYSVDCGNGTIKTFYNQDKANSYFYECNHKNSITYININNISFINGIK